MLIKDTGGKYELKVDKGRRIVYEKLMGSWDEDVFNRFDSEYRSKIVGALGEGKWMKCSDMREYTPTIKVTPDMMNGHLQFVSSKGFCGGAILLGSATTKMQLKRASNSVEAAYFDNEKDADTWLKAQGF